MPAFSRTTRASKNSTVAVQIFGTMRCRVAPVIITRIAVCYEQRRPRCLLTNFITRDGFSGGNQTSATAETKKPSTLASKVLGSGDVLLSHGLSPYYHRGCSVSLPCSEWERVVPPRYCHQRFAPNCRSKSLVAAACGVIVIGD